MPRVNRPYPRPTLPTDDRTVAANACSAAACREPARDTFVFCKHVGGTVQDHVCVVFREQMTETGRRACDGCIIDAVLRRPQDSVRDAFRHFNA